VLKTGFFLEVHSFFLQQKSAVFEVSEKSDQHRGLFPQFEITGSVFEEIELVMQHGLYPESSHFMLV